MAATLTDGRSSGGFAAPASQLLGCLSRVALGVTVCRLALYFGLKTRTLFGAISQTLLVSVVVTSFVGPILFQLLAYTFSLSSESFWYYQFIVETIGLGYTVWLFRWADRKLIARFRELAVPSA